MQMTNQPSIVTRLNLYVLKLFSEWPMIPVGASKNIPLPVLSVSAKKSKGNVVQNSTQVKVTKTKTNKRK
jgi:hypothetical protein